MSLNTCFEKRSSRHDILGVRIQAETDIDRALGLGAGRYIYIAVRWTTLEAGDLEESLPSMGLLIVVGPCL